jgi:hypothetical protein
LCLPGLCLLDEIVLGFAVVAVAAAAVAAAVAVAAEIGLAAEPHCSEPVQGSASYAPLEKCMQKQTADIL